MNTWDEGSNIPVGQVSSGSVSFSVAWTNIAKGDSCRAPLLALTRRLRDLPNQLTCFAFGSSEQMGVCLGSGLACDAVGAGGYHPQGLPPLRGARAGLRHARGVSHLVLRAGGRAGAAVSRVPALHAPHGEAVSRGVAELEAPSFVATGACCGTGGVLLLTNLEALTHSTMKPLVP